MSAVSAVTHQRSAADISHSPALAFCTSAVATAVGRSGSTLARHAGSLLASVDDRFERLHSRSRSYRSLREPDYHHRSRSNSIPEVESEILMSIVPSAMSSPQKPTWSQAPARSITFDAGSKAARQAPTLRDVPGTAASTNAGRQAALLPTATGSDPATPFSDGITERRAERYGEENLPPQMALKLEWPLDEVGYNKLRKEGGKGASAGGPSLVYYRKYLEMDGSDDVVHTGIKLALKGHADINIAPGKVLFRVVCEKPCWATESRRYESPIQVGIGRAGPIVYEVRPTAPKGGRNKRQSQWTLHQKRTSMQTRARTEDLEGTLISFLSPWGMPFQVYTTQETKVKLEFKDAEYEVAQFDPADGFGALHIDGRPYGTPFKSPRRSAIEVAYIIAVFEAAHAMRDELAGGGKGRRDEYGRLSLINKGTLAKAFSRILRT